MTVPAYTLPVEELEALVERAVRRATAVQDAPREQPSEVLTRLQAAKLLHVNPHQIPRLVNQGLPAHRLGKKQWRFYRREVVEWLGKQDRGV